MQKNKVAFPLLTSVFESFVKFPLTVVQFNSLWASVKVKGGQMEAETYLKGFQCYSPLASVSRLALAKKTLTLANAYYRTTVLFVGYRRYSYQQKSHYTKIMLFGGQM